MNGLDYAILLLMTISIVSGAYNGFVFSALNAVSFFLSWILSLIFYPLLSRHLMTRYESLFQRLVHFTEGSSKIPSVEARNARLSSLSETQIGNLLEEIQLPNPFHRILAADVFAANGSAQTLGQYFDTTIAVILVNILSFLLLFFLIKLFFVVLLSVSKAVVNLPVLKQFDALLGGAFGVLRGFFVLYFLFAMIPIIMTLAPVDVLGEYLEGSRFAGFFYQFNLFTSLVRGKPS